MWQLDGDGITHRIKLHAGPSRLPGTFRDHISIAFCGYDELCARVGLTPRGTFIPGTKIRCRDHWRLWNRHLPAEAVRYREVVDRHKAEYGENLEKGNPLFFYEFVERIPYLNGERFGDNSSYWQVDMSSLQAAAKQMILLWERVALPELRQNFNHRYYYDIFIKSGLTQISRDFIKDPLDFIDSFLAEDIETTKKMFDSLLMFAKRDISDLIEVVKFEHRNAKYVHGGRHLIKSKDGEDEIRKIAERRLMIATSRLRSVVRHNKIIGYGLPDVDFDFSYLEDWEKLNGEAKF